MARGWLRVVELRAESNPLSTLFGIDPAETAGYDFW